MKQKLFDAKFELWLCVAVGEQLQRALGGSVLMSVRLAAPWERVVELTFGVRPGEEYTHRLLLEVGAPLPSR